MLLAAERETRVEAELEVGGGEVLDGAVLARPAVEERAAEVAAPEERGGEHEWRIGETREIHGADGVGALEGELLLWGPGIDRHVASETVFLQHVKGLLLDGLDVVLVREADDGGKLVEGEGELGVGRIVAGKGVNRRERDKMLMTYSVGDMGKSARRRCARSQWNSRSSLTTEHPQRDSSALELEEMNISAKTVDCAARRPR